MAKEVENQKKPPEATTQVEVKRAETKDLDKVMDGADVSYDLVSKIKELRFKVKDIRRIYYLRSRKITRVNKKRT